ncbi:MAG: hypothetical protein ACRD5K_07990 [Candidatus Acidiferrales bacterium]
MPRATPFSIVRKVFGWFVLAVLIVTLALLLRTSPPPIVITNAAAAASAENKLDAADQAAQSGQPAQVRLDSTELNSYLAQNLQLAGSTSTNSGDEAGTPAVEGVDAQTAEQAESSVENVKIALDGDLVRTYVIFNFHGKDLSLEIDGHLYTQDGYLKFDPADGRFGSFPLPQSAVQEAVQRLMESPENRERLRLPAYISDMSVENSQLLISYK